jgi:ubiquitin-like modifier-activating enzyme ATG7
MKWRALPAFDEALVAKQKVLLLGAGTLGCAVARGLLGWGFRHITFVDQGRVSYSNPVRQSLFVAKDCLGHGRVKAVAAAEALKDIYPAVDARGVELQIPMPGHADANVEANLSQLDALVREHDCVVLLTDTWESRWLPTVLGAAHEKMVINAALGFDSLVVMRHGGPTCGCYFCSDVVAPRDSTRNRTLDQQCTVTRPGLAPIAGALVVELLVGLVHHPLQRLAPAGAQSLLGALFHQCRLFLPQMDIAKIQGMAFAECTACSPKMVAAYRANGLGLVQNALADPSSLERVTGLAELQALASKGMLEMEEEEDGDGDDF